MSVLFYHVDAFTAQPFAGNPAAVVILQSDEQFNDDSHLQKIATEFNLPATAFLLPSTQTVNNAVLKQKIKWFDPSKRIPICGHGTLAASHVLFEGNTQANTIEYDAGPAGALIARRDKEDSIVLDFPACRLVGTQDAGQAIKDGINLEQVLQSLFPDDVKIEFVGRGDRGGYVDLLVVEVMENYPLKGKKLNNHVLVGNHYATILP
jgi:PhzF family phenazine biosynthesis protein